MSGIGPGHEQCVQITAAEMVRVMLANAYPMEWMDHGERWKQIEEELNRSLRSNPVVCALGLTGAQWGAALSLGSCLYKDGPRTLMKRNETKGRRIQASKHFP
jgi:hypothetical protein